METTNSRLPDLPDKVREVDPRPFLSCHVYAPPGAEPSFYAAWPGRLGSLERVERRLKLELELDHWLRLCLQLAPAGKRKGVGTLFRAELGDLDEAGVARTLRILRGIEALFLGGSPFYPLIGSRTSATLPRIEFLQDQAARIPGDFANHPDWQIDLPLLLIRAAAWSQTGRQQPYLWEAYSAWRIRQAHERPGWLGASGRSILTFLVRYQSAPGQYVRETGDACFFNVARRVAADTKLNLKVLLTALGVLAVAQDFRNRKLIHAWEGAASQGPREEEVRLVGGNAYERVATKFKPFWDLVDSLPNGPATGPAEPKCQRKSTWSYSRWLSREEGVASKGSAKRASTLLSPTQVKQFQNLAEKSHPGVAAFSFGRDYRSEMQQRRVIEAIRSVLQNPGLLEQTFTFNTIPVLDCLNDQREEILVEIRLRDDVTATDMVFRGLDPEKLGERQDRAWEIYHMLFETAMKRGLICWPATAEQAGPRYCPTALVGRFLEVAHRLHPGDCVSIPIRLNEDRTCFLHLPRAPLDIDLGRPEIQAAARYVPAWVLNQIMMKEVTTCQVALKDLEESAAGSFWKILIEDEIKTNHFEILLYNYLSDYLAEPRQVLLVQGLLDLLPPLEQPSPDPGSESLALLQAVKAAGDRDPPVILGVDIGGSFIKMRFFQLEGVSTSGSNASHLKPIGSDFRVLTTSDGDTADEKLASFVSRIGDRIRAEALELKLSPVADAIGVTWPGPVRRQRVQGTSGILAKLGFSRNIPENDIHKIMEMDLAKRLEGCIFGEGADARTVTLINDGNSHALGILADAFLGRWLKSSGDEELGVVVKAGTGTAGAVIRNGLPGPGLMEFGKLLTNLAYQCVAAPQFPKGVASEYCSSRTLPELMRNSLAHVKTLNPPIESIEVGRLVEIDLAIEAGDLEGVCNILRRLAWDSGKIAIAGLFRKIAPELDVVALETLSDNWLKGSRQLREKVAQYLALGIADVEDAREPLQQRIREYGENRLRSLLDFGTSEAGTALRKLLDEGVAQSREMEETFAKIQQTASKARQAVNSLGIYIGDLLALLYLTHRMDYAVIGGGVLSNVSGRLATEAAVDRLQIYNEIAAHSQRRAGTFTIRFSNRGSAAAEPSPERPAEQDPGIVGAALAGVLELLRQKRLDGLKRVIEIVHRLGLMDALEIRGSEVRELRKGTVPPSGKPLNLEAFALDADRVRRHLDQAAPRLGLVRTLTDYADKRYTYTRWLPAEVAGANQA
jgi:hypothetical protein